MAITEHPANLDQYKALIKNNKLVAVDFFAVWCGPCKVIGPKFEKLSDVYSDIVFAKVDVDEAPDVASEVSVRAMPTFVFYKNGEKIGEVIGANLSKIEEQIKALLA
ncbi:Allergen Cop c 2 [Phycomyces nitens]|nr:Allergen Cop c 2 [Phycomyces nitens]